MPEKEFVAYFDRGRILVRRVTRAGRVIDFSVVLLVELDGGTHDVPRYDTAHGTPYRDVIGRKKGPLAKEWFFDSSFEEVLNMQSTISELPPRITFASTRKTDSGISCVTVPHRSQKTFKVEACDRILKGSGFRPITDSECEEFARFR